MQNAAAIQRGVRERRAEALARRRRTVRHATDIYRTVDHGNAPEICFREQFVWLPRERPAPVGLDGDDDGAALRSRTDRLTRDWSSRPPATRLLKRRNNGMSLYLTAIYVAHQTAEPTTAVPNARANTKRHDGLDPWAALAGLGLGSDQRARRAQVTRALDQLHLARLVDLRRGTRGVQYEGFALLQDDGSLSRYILPSPDEATVVKLPATFFYNGWHLVLEPDEIAMLLAIRHATVLAQRQGIATEHGVAIPRALRWSRYGISSETYTAVNELQEFGLIRIIELMPNRRHGRLRRVGQGDDDPDQSFAPILYRFVIDEAAFDQDAWEIIHRALTKFKEPPRLSHG